MTARPGRHLPRPDSRSLNVQVLLRRAEFREHGARLDQAALGPSAGRHHHPRRLTRPQLALFVALTPQAWLASRPLQRAGTGASS